MLSAFLADIALCVVLALELGILCLFLLTWVRASFSFKDAVISLLTSYQRIRTRRLRRTMVGRFVQIRKACPPAVDPFLFRSHVHTALIASAEVVDPTLYILMTLVDPEGWTAEVVSSAYKCRQIVKNDGCWCYDSPDTEWRLLPQVQETP